MTWGTYADWAVAIGTAVLAFVAVFQSTIRGWFYRPKFNVTAKTEPPDCVAVPITHVADGTLIANSVFLRLWIENIGNAPAINAEVYAKELRRLRADDKWERVAAFPPMNLKWANLGLIHYPAIAPEMGKHCDVAHIVDPAKRKHSALAEDNPTLGLTDDETSLTFELQAGPNHRGHIIGPGTYRLHILVAAANAKPRKLTVEIKMDGKWDHDETKMLRSHVGISVLPT